MSQTDLEKPLFPQNSENKQITDGNYDQSLAVKCINGTFVGKKDENIISYKGIPFVGQQPIGHLRWKAPVDVTPDDGVYEAYYFPKASCQDKSVITYHRGKRNPSWCGFTAVLLLLEEPE